MIGLIFATFQEAEPFLSISRATTLDAGPFHLHETRPAGSLCVAVSGMGKIAAATACQYLIREKGVSHVINAGVCGALRTGDDFSPGAFFRITSVVEGDHGTEAQAAPVELCPCDWPDHLAEARLVTCDQPVFGSRQRQALSARGDLVDMEGAAVARVAACFETPWTLIKAVTDRAGPKDRSTLLNNLRPVSAALADFLWREIGLRFRV